MINDYILAQIKPIISDPGWEYIKNRIKLLVDYYDKKLHAATKDEFEYLKGCYNVAKHILFLFENPTQFADDGIRKIGGEE